MTFDVNEFKTAAACEARQAELSAELELAVATKRDGKPGNTVGYRQALRRNIAALAQRAGDLTARAERDALRGRATVTEVATFGRPKPPERSATKVVVPDSE